MIMFMNARQVETVLNSYLTVDVVECQQEIFAMTGDALPAGNRWLLISVSRIVNVL